MSSGLESARYLTFCQQGGDSDALFAAAALQQQQKFEQDAKHAVNVMQDQQSVFENTADPIVEKMLNLKPLAPLITRLEELQQKEERLQGVQHRLEQGFAKKNQGLEYQINQLAQSRFALKQINAQAKQIGGPHDERIAQFSKAVTAFIRDHYGPS